MNLFMVQIIPNNSFWHDLKQLKSLDEAIRITKKDFSNIHYKVFSMIYQFPLTITIQRWYHFYQTDINNFQENKCLPNHCIKKCYSWMSIFWNFLFFFAWHNVIYLLKCRRNPIRFSKNRNNSQGNLTGNPISTISLTSISNLIWHERKLYPKGFALPTNCTIFWYPDIDCNWKILVCICNDNQKSIFIFLGLYLSCK